MFFLNQEIIPRSMVSWHCPCKVAKHWWKDGFVCANSETQFLVPDWGMKPAMESCCRTGPPAYMQHGGPVRQPYALASFIPQTGTQNTANDFFLCIGVGANTILLNSENVRQETSGVRIWRKWVVLSCSLHEELHEFAQKSLKRTWWILIQYWENVKKNLTLLSFQFVERTRVYSVEKVLK